MLVLHLDTITVLKPYVFVLKIFNAFAHILEHIYLYLLSKILLSTFGLVTLSQMTLADEFANINLGDMNTIKRGIPTISCDSGNVAGKNASCLGQSKLCREEFSA